jgi:hypothetical protein
MIFSRSLPAAAGAAGLAAEEDRAALRAGLWTMTELLCTELLGNAIGQWAMLLGNAPYGRLLDSM